jgi:hypothetical protein
LFFTIQKFDFLVYSISGCCYSDVPALSVISVEFDAVVFWRQLLGFTYFVEPNLYTKSERLLVPKYLGLGLKGLICTNDS